MSNDYQLAVEIVAAHLCDSTVEYFRLNGDSFRNFHKDKARSLLRLTWPSSQPVIAVLAKDQETPTYSYALGSKEAMAYYRGTQAMLAAGFRRVVQSDEVK